MARQRSSSPSGGLRSHPPIRQSTVPNHTRTGKVAASAGLKHQDPAPPSQKSSFVSQLKGLNSKDVERESLTRTEGFEERPAAPMHSESAKVPLRDDRLAIIEDLVPGPMEHSPTPDDPNFSKAEPNSGIRLKYVPCSLDIDSIAYYGWLRFDVENGYCLTPLFKIIFPADTIYRHLCYTLLYASKPGSKHMKCRSRVIGSP